MPFQSILLIVVAFINSLLALAVLVRNHKSRLHVLFALTIVSNTLWALGTAFALSSSEQSFNFYIRIFLISPVFTALFLLLFSRKLAGRQNSNALKVITSSIALAVGLLVYRTGSVLENVLIGDGLNVFRVSMVPFGIYTLYFFIFFNMSYYVLLKGARTKDSSKAGQLRNILYAALITSGPAFISNLVVPLVFNSSEYIWLGPLFTPLYVVIVGISITRYQLFDIRLTVLRAVAYIATFIALFLMAQMGLILVLGDNFELSLPSIFAALLFFASGLLVKPMRTYFDKLTNKLFYRDAYNTQEQIDKLSKIAVSEYEIDSLVSSSLYLVSQSIKPVTGKFILLDAHGDYYNDYKLAKSPRFGTLKMVDELKAQTEQVFIVDEFEYTDKNKSHTTSVRLYEYLKEHDISMSVRLSTKDEIVGYILFGPKLSGNLYSTQDKQFVAIASNEMAISIQNARRFDEIKEFNETLKLEVDRATSELRDSNDKLQALDQAKDEFITMASHQLRTPLTSIKGYLSMVLEGDVGKVSKDQQEMITSAFTSSQRMVYLIADLLNVSRLQTGKFVIEPTVMNMTEVVESEIDQLKETAKAKRIKVRLKAPKNMDDVYMDETKTRQVVMNFIDNAIYYTPAGGEINVELKAGANSVEFSVKDNGIGVPKAEQHNLFTKFYRAENARKARPDGTGLGLFMAKKVIVDQGGALIFDSKEGSGSTFGFTFPLSRVRLPKKLAK